MNKTQVEVLAWSIAWEGRIGLSKQTQKPKKRKCPRCKSVDYSPSNGQLLCQNCGYTRKKCRPGEYLPVILLRPRIDISNTDRALLEKFKEYVGCGAVNNKDHPSKRAAKCKWKDLHVFRFGAIQECESVLRSIVNSLPAKKEQATLLLEFIALRKKATHLGNEQKSYSPREWEIYERVKVLNTRGLILSSG